MFKTFLLALTLTFTSCASMFLHGGELVSKRAQPEVLVDYTAEGSGVPAGVSYALVRTESGETGVFERSADGSGTIITNQWREGDEDHFFCWVGSSHGYEYVIPVDRTQPGRKYVYPAGYFSVDKVNGIEKPNCPAELDPVATLTPR